MKNGTPYRIAAHVLLWPPVAIFLCGAVYAAVRFAICLAEEPTSRQPVSIGLILGLALVGGIVCLYRADIADGRWPPNDSKG